MGLGRRYAQIVVGPRPSAPDDAADPKATADHAADFKATMDDTTDDAADPNADPNADHAADPNQIELAAAGGDLTWNVFFKGRPRAPYAQGRSLYGGRI